MPSVASAEKSERQIWMGVLARARAERLAELMPPDPPDYDLLRPAEIGAVMVRGRVGAVGTPFNLGEMTVTRCSLRLKSGEVGHAHVQGRDRDHALRAALVDAMLQGPRGADLRTGVIAVLAAEEEARRTARAARAAATKVEFFTLARGEDQ